MSLFKGFSVVGLALERFFLEHTKLCSAPAAWAVCTDTDGLGTDLDAGIGAEHHGDKSCLPGSHAQPWGPHWEQLLNNLRVLKKFSFLYLFQHKSVLCDLQQCISQ